jgi:tRNA(adenine34) deaminase
MADADDVRFMRRALELAAEAEAMGEVPVGAVVVLDGRIVGEGFNRPIALCDPTAHAEVNALREAARTLGVYRVLETTVYVTLEPCAMCVGAMIHARVRRVVFGAHDPKTGACGGAFDLAAEASHNHHLAVTGGVEETACARQLRAFYRARRRGASR